MTRDKFEKIAVDVAGKKASKKTIEACISTAHAIYDEIRRKNMYLTCEYCGTQFSWENGIDNNWCSLGCKNAQSLNGRICNTIKRNQHDR